MRRFFRLLMPKKGERRRAQGASSSKATENDDVGVIEELSPVTEPRTSEPSHIEAETVIQHADDVIAHTDNITVSAQDAEIHAQHAEIDVADVHVQEAHVQVQHANLQAQNVQVNQEIDTLIQHAEEVHTKGASVVHAENVRTVLTGVVQQHVKHFHTHLHQQPIAGSSKSDDDKLVKEFCESVNDRSLKETSGGVADSYREQNITEPGKEFSPQLKKINFYKGDWVPKKKMTRIQRIKKAVAKKRSVQENMCLEYVKENVFASKENNKEGNDISKKEILHFVEKQSYATGGAEIYRQEQSKQKRETQRYKAIVGQAGSGKTTLMKRLARDVIRGKLLIQKGQNEPFKPEFVHYLNIRDIPVTDKKLKKITPCDLLFGKVMPKVKKESINHGFEWLQNNQDRAVFFLDGLDQATWILQGDSNPIRYEDKASTSTIMENLLEGNLFSNVLIIISSREHALSPLTGNLRPHEIIGLAGFTMGDRKQVFIGLAGEDGENLWNLMCTKSPALVPLASIPIFLVFIVIIYKFDPENPPDTMSGIMTKILQIFLQSDHAHERENIMEILKGLKQMSFKGTEEGRVLFTHKDLEEFNLIPKSVRDLVVFVPGSTLLGKNLMDGHYRLFFCHQSIQELFSALCIIEKDLEAFTKFVNESLHEDHWSVVRRFVCGILLNEETHSDVKDGDLIDVSDVDEKRQILKQSLRKQLQTSTMQYRKQLELFASFYESNDSKFIQSNVHEIKIERQPLSPNDMYVISSVLRRCSQVELVQLVKCNLNPETVNILTVGLQSSQLKINRFEVWENDIGNQLLTSDTCSVLCSIVRQCQVEEFITDGISIEKVDKNSPTKVGRLYLKRKLCVEEMSALGSALSHYDEMNYVNLQGCEFQADEMKCFMEAVAHIKIKILDVDRNESMGAESWKTIGSVVYKCQVRELYMKECNLSKDEIKRLQEGLGDSKIKILDVSWNKNMGTDGWETIGFIVNKCQVEELKMRYCHLTDRIKSLLEGLDDSKLKILDVSQNQNMGTDGCKTIGSIVQKCQVEELDMTLCYLSADEIKALQEGLADSKIKVLEFSMPRDPTHDFLQAIANLLHRCHLQKFVLRDSQFLSNEVFIERAAGDTEILFE